MALVGFYMKKAIQILLTIVSFCKGYLARILLGGQRQAFANGAILRIAENASFEVAANKERLNPMMNLDWIHCTSKSRFSHPFIDNWFGAFKSGQLRGFAK